MRRNKTKQANEDFEPLSKDQLKKLKNAVADIDDPIRYAVFSDIGGFGTFRLWLDISSDCYGRLVEQATLFKRERVALAVAKACSTNRRYPLLVAKITTKNKKIRVVKYGKHTTSREK